jgi:hypothetical protein
MFTTKIRAKLALLIGYSISDAHRQWVKIRNPDIPVRVLGQGCPIYEEK